MVDQFETYWVPEKNGEHGMTWIICVIRYIYIYTLISINNNHIIYIYILIIYIYIFTIYHILYIYIVASQVVPDSDGSPTCAVMDP